MLIVNKPLFISKQTMNVTWQHIPWLPRKLLSHHKIFHDAEKYSTTSFNNIHMEDEYIRNIP
jgi:hypothetical protein